MPACLSMRFALQEHGSAPDRPLARSVTTNPVPPHRTHVSSSTATPLFQCDEHVAGADRISVFGGDAQHAASPDGLHLILHLHRFDDGEALSGLHVVAFTHE